MSLEEDWADAESRPGAGGGLVGLLLAVLIVAAAVAVIAWGFAGCAPEIRSTVTDDVVGGPSKTKPEHAPDLFPKVDSLFAGEQITKYEPRFPSQSDEWGSYYIIPPHEGDIVIAVPFGDFANYWIVERTSDGRYLATPYLRRGP